MPEQVSQTESDLEIKALPPQLWSFQFRRKQEDEPKQGEHFNFNFGFAFARKAPNLLGVQIEIESDENAYVYFKASCRSDFKLGDKLDPNIPYDAHFKDVAARTAPVVLYPFIREAIMTASVKSGMKPIMLPVINFAGLLSPDQLSIPPFLPDTDDADGAPVEDPVDEVNHKSE